MKKIVNGLETNHVYQATILCEPQMGRRGLYPTLSQSRTTTADEEVAKMMDFLAYADGENSLLDIADIINIDIHECAEIAQKMEENALVARV